MKLWLPAHILRPLTPADIAPISPHADGKLIVVNLAHQSLSAFEGANEVFRCLVSTGKHYVKDGRWVEAQTTPVITAPIWSKRMTRHMQGGSATAGWDIPGVPFASFFQRWRSGAWRVLAQPFWRAALRWLYQLHATGSALDLSVDVARGEIFAGLCGLALAGRYTHTN